MLPLIEQMKPEPVAGPEGLYTEIVDQLKEQGVLCAITGGLACVQFGVAHYTEDCDLICAPNDAAQLLNLLRQKTYENAPCLYRGLTAPLDERWLAGGYTAHFYWLGKSVDQPFWMSLAFRPASVPPGRTKGRVFLQAPIPSPK